MFDVCYQLSLQEREAHAKLRRLASANAREVKRFWGQVGRDARIGGRCVGHLVDTTRVCSFGGWALDGRLWMGMAWRGWGVQVGKLVAHKQNALLESKRAEVRSLHLDYLVERTER